MILARRAGWQVIYVNLFVQRGFALALDFVVQPRDCSPEDCRQAIQGGVRKCARHEGVCNVLLVAGATYPVRCPSSGLAAIDLSGLSNVTFGAEDGESTILVDYQGQACTAIGINGTSNLTMRNLNIDTVRMPFSVLTVRETSIDGRHLAFTTENQVEYSWNWTKYPWLSHISDISKLQSDGSGLQYSRDSSLTGFNSARTASTPPFLTQLTWVNASNARASFRVGDVLFMKHFRNLPSHGVHGRNSSNIVLYSVKLLSGAGMGIRCDLCTGQFAVEQGGVLLKQGRPMSTTADAFHFMHHGPGEILLADVAVEGAGDDAFNAHGNFIVLQHRLGDRSCTYVAQTGSGWLPDAVEYMVGDEVRFYSRETLADLGTNKLVSANSGVLVFAEAFPTALKDFDMFISLHRTSIVKIHRSNFSSAFQTPVGSEVAISAVVAEVLNCTFHNMANAALKFINGGCGSSDWSEGPFAQKVDIIGNSFANAALDLPHRLWAAMVQMSGCSPVAECGKTRRYSYNCSLPPKVETSMLQGALERYIYNDGRFATESKIFANVTIADNLFVMDSGGWNPKTGKLPWKGNVLHLGAIDGLSMSNNVVKSRLDLRDGGSHDACVYASRWQNGSASYGHLPTDALSCSKIVGSSSEPTACAISYSACDSIDPDAARTVDASVNIHL